MTNLNTIITNTNNILKSLNHNIEVSTTYYNNKVQIIIFYLEDKKIITLNTIKNISESWIINKILNRKSNYKNIQHIFENTIVNKKLNNINLNSIYYTSFGFSYIIIGNKNYINDINMIKSILNNHNINFKSNISNKGFVYNFFISKSKNNLDSII